jgi:hypothetical protein
VGTFSRAPKGLAAFLLPDPLRTMSQELPIGGPPYFSFDNEKYVNQKLDRLPVQAFYLKMTFLDRDLEYTYSAKQIGCQPQA